MKIALLTIHDYWSMNYGAVMQAYATTRILKELGHDVTLVNLGLSKDRKITPKTIFHLPKLLGFRRFAHKFYPRRTPRYTTVEELRANPPLADLYLVGSDQVWNIEITTGDHEAFFLGFGSPDVPRVSFASSFGQQWSGTAGQTERVRELLSRFSSVMVREEISLRQCTDVFGLENVSLVPDPTLVAGAFPELIGSNARKWDSSGEVVFYGVLNNPVRESAAQEIAGALGLPIRGLSFVRPRKGFRMGYPTEVEEWVTRIASAGVVITDSFHGMVFSILHKRNFVAFVGGERSGRLTHLANVLGLDDRLCHDGADTETIRKIIDTPIDYDKVHSCLAKMRAESIALLRKSIEKHA